MSLSQIPIDIIKTHLIQYLTGVERSRLYGTCRKYYYMYGQFDRIKSIRYDWFFNGKNGKPHPTSICPKCRISMRSTKIDTHNCQPLSETQLQNVDNCKYCKQPIAKNRMPFHVEKCIKGKLQVVSCKFCDDTDYNRIVKPQLCHKNSTFYTPFRAPMTCATCGEISTDYTSGCTSCQIIQCIRICEICKKRVKNDCQGVQDHVCHPGIYDGVYVNCFKNLLQWDSYIRNIPSGVFTLFLAENIEVDARYHYANYRDQNIVARDNISVFYIYFISLEEVTDEFIAKVKTMGYTRACIVTDSPICTGLSRIRMCTKGFINPEDPNPRDWIQLF